MLSEERFCWKIGTNPSRDQHFFPLCVKIAVFFLRGDEKWFIYRRSILKMAALPPHHFHVYISYQPTANFPDTGKLWNPRKYQNEI